jgi:hypothetical protein
VAISSITKQFVIKDGKVYEKLLNDIKHTPAPQIIHSPSSLEKGREALVHFSLR